LERGWDSSRKEWLGSWSVHLAEEWLLGVKFEDITMIQKLEGYMSWLVLSSTFSIGPQFVKENAATAIPLVHVNPGEDGGDKRAVVSTSGKFPC